MKYIVYTDGSYKNIPRVGEFYGSAATIQREGEDSVLASLTKVSSDAFVSMRNVAGEIIAAIMALDHCNRVLRLKQTDVVELRYDYAGIENWCKKSKENGFWRAKNELSQTYRDYVNCFIKTQFRLVFKHVDAHTGEAGNERVDALAKNAIDKHVQELLR